MFTLFTLWLKKYILHIISLVSFRCTSGKKNLTTMNTKVFTKGSKTYFLSFVRSVVEKNLTTKNTKVFTKDSKTSLCLYAAIVMYPLQYLVQLISVVSLSKTL